MFNFRPFAIKPICFQPGVVVNINWGEGLLMAEVIRAQPLMFPEGCFVAHRAIAY